MKKMNNKAIAGIGLIAILAVGGTFAYYNQTLSLDNPLSTGHYENQLVEEYTPETEKLTPGTTLDKVVGATNTGNYPVLVRIRMDEKWQKGADTTLIEQSSDNIDEFEVVYKDEDTYPYVNDLQYSETINYERDDNGYPVYDDAGDPVMAQGDDGLVTYETLDGGVVTIEGVDYEQDGSVVRKNLAVASTDGTWVYGGDGYWYYNGVLEGGDSTGPLMDSITLASNVDLGKYVEEDYYSIATEQPSLDDEDAWTLYTVVREKDDEGIYWVTDIKLNGTSVGDLNGDGITNAIDMARALLEEEDEDGNWVRKEEYQDTDENGEYTYNLYRQNKSLLDETKTGYADATYTLLITSEFVQASSDAVDAIWTDTSAAAIESLINISADSDGIYSTKDSTSTETGSGDGNTEESEAETDAATE